MSDYDSEEVEEEYLSDYDEFEEEKFYVEIIQVKPENRMTTDIVSEFEQVGVDAIRINQIMKYNNALIPNDKNLDEVGIAKKEREMGKSPISISRSNKKIEKGKLIEYVEIINLDHTVIFSKK